MAEENNGNNEMLSKTITAECKLYAKEVSDKARNQSLAIFAFIALIVGILTSVGVFGLAKNYIDKAFENALSEAGTKKLLTEIQAAKLNAEQSAALIRGSLESSKATETEIGDILNQYKNPQSKLEVGGDLIALNNKWSGDTTVVGYGNGVHAWVDKSASCPDGFYVVGVKVTHGGTCHNQCDPDGAVIREIKLVCKEL